MRDIKSLKKLANEKLSSCWCESFLIVFITFAIVAGLASFCIFIIYLFNILGFIDYGESSYFFSFSPLQLTLILCYSFLCCFILFPLRHGVNWFYYQTVLRNPPEIFSIFSCYSTKTHFFKISLLNIVLFFKKSIVAIPLLTITFIEIFSYIKICQISNNAFFNIISLICSLILISINISLYILFSSKYFLVYHIYSANPILSVK